MYDRSFLLEQAAKFRRLAREILDPEAERVLLDMAEEYEARATQIENADCMSQ